MRFATGSTTAALAIAAGCYGLVVMVGWAVRVPALVEFGLGQRFVPFGAGLGLALGGFTWAWLAGGERAVWRGSALVGVALMLLALASLAEIAFDLELAVDLPALHRWLLHDGLHPGRLAAPTAAWLGLFGAFVLLFQARGRRAAALTLEPLAFLMLLVAIVGLISNWLSIDDLYRWRQSPRVSLPTAVGLTVLSVSVWLGVRRDSRVQQLYATREEWMLTMLAGEILIMMAFVGGLAGFAALQHSLEDQLSEALSANLANRAQNFESVILNGAQSNGVLASRAALVRPVVLLNEGANPDAEAALDSAARGFLLLGYKQILYRGLGGRVLAGAGEASGDPGVALALPDDTRLTWDAQGFVMTQRIVMLRGNEPVGWLETAQYLRALTDAYRDFRGLGPTADSVLCAKQADGVFCFPGRNGKAATLRLSGHDVADPVTAALDGASGLARFVDERNEPVIAAYAPVGTLGLGLLLTVDLRELYAPVRRELERVVPLLLILIVVGTLVLSSQVTPLASRLRRLATLDGLTGVLNRATYMRMSEHELAVARRRRQAVSVVMLDADHFKRVNDNYGHDIGDEVLRRLAATCQSTLRAVDVVGRLGGEEFALTLPDTAPDGAQLVAERLRQRVAALEVPTKRGVLRFTVSIGVAGYPSGGDSVAGLLKAADEALYAAKRGGRNRVVVAGQRVAEKVA
jgi:diguanylate cyclase (GGDEF)-like protein